MAGGLHKLFHSGLRNDLEARSTLAEATQPSGPVLCPGLLCSGCDLIQNELTEVGFLQLFPVGPADELPPRAADLIPAYCYCQFT